MKTSFRIRKTQGRRQAEINVSSHMNWLSANDRADEIESGNQVFENGDIQVVFSKFEQISDVVVNQVFAAIANELVETRIVEHPDGAEYNYYDARGMMNAENAAARIFVGAK
jgi:hypothetical protein